jgi:signal transduction histidine kinase
MQRNWLTPGRRELFLAVALTVALGLEFGLAGRLTTPGRVAAALLITAPLAVRLRFPLGVVTLVVTGVVLEAALGAFARPGFPVFPVICVLVALYALGSRASGARLAVGAGLVLAGLLAANFLTGHADLGNFAVDIVVTGGGLLIGRALGVLRFEADAFAEREVAQERERDERVRVAVADERRRIARELHDVIGHSISVMGVQAGAVRSVLRDDQWREREALLAVERTGRQAVGEMRRLIGLLRTEQDGVGDPTPSLRRAEGLVSEMRDAGLVLRVGVQGDLSGLSPGVDLAGFRILQEALTNILKHAPDAHAVVRVSCTAQELTIEVIDDGGTAPRGPYGHVGHGLVGMRERTSLYGGEFAARPRPGGGFAVCARIPVEVS